MSPGNKKRFAFLAFCTNNASDTKETKGNRDISTIYNSRQYGSYLYGKWLLRDSYTWFFFYFIDAARSSVTLDEQRSILRGQECLKYPIQRLKSPRTSLSWLQNRFSVVRAVGTPQTAKTLNFTVKLFILEMKFYLFIYTYLFLMKRNQRTPRQGPEPWKLDKWTAEWDTIWLFLWYIKCIQVCDKIC